MDLGGSGSWPPAEPAPVRPRGLVAVPGLYRIRCIPIMKTQIKSSKAGIGIICLPLTHPECRKNCFRVFSWSWLSPAPGRPVGRAVGVLHDLDLEPESIHAGLMKPKRGSYLIQEIEL